jgi:murein DD-endopeptidase MepM/ murein hydrolase activator NlpD
MRRRHDDLNGQNGAEGDRDDRTRRPASPVTEQIAMPRRLVLAVLTLAAGPALAAPMQERLLPPVSPACVSSPYGPRVLPGHPQAGAYHYGIDLPAPLGAPIRAAADGTVLRIERRGAGGLEMLVQHPGFVGVYSHFGTVAPFFAEGGRTVTAGEKLGVVGLTGVTFGPHLYFGMLVGDRPVDPERYLDVPACKTGAQVIVAGRSVLGKDGKILPSRVIYASARGTRIGRATHYVTDRR